MIGMVPMTQSAQSAPPVVLPAPDGASGRSAEIVVTARHRARRPIDAVEYYRRYCFEPNRIAGHAEGPVDDPDWLPLSAKDRRKFDIGDPSVPAFGLANPASGQTLLMKSERFDRPGGLVESRCTMVVIGGDQSSLASRMSTVFAGGPTQRHVGATDGSPRIAGWRQWLWTGMPARRSKSWKAFNGSGRETSDHWLVVSDPRFYNDYDYILGDLKTRQGSGMPLSVLSFAYVTRPHGP